MRVHFLNYSLPKVCRNHGRICYFHVLILTATVNIKWVVMVEHGKTNISFHPNLMCMCLHIRIFTTKLKCYGILLYSVYNYNGKTRNTINVL